MNYIEAVALGILQGLTEFLPVSSSGHLVIGQKLIGLSQPPILFDILVHLGTLLSVVVYFKNRFLKLKAKIILLIIIGTIPAGLVGLFLNHYIERIFDSLAGVGFSLLITSILLFSTKFIKDKFKQFNKLNWKNALFIGCFQALAILPGVSRSGSTIVAGLSQGLSRKNAFIFSFYLAVPAILGALVLQIPDIADLDSQSLNLGLIGTLTAFIFGLLSIKILEKVVYKGKLYYFAAYCLILGLLVLLKSFVF